MSRARSARCTANIEKLSQILADTRLDSLIIIGDDHVSGLELGQRNPTVVTLWHIAEALGVKLRHFFEEEARGRRQGR